MAANYIAFNAPAPTTASLVAVTTGTLIKTMLQIATPATGKIRVIEWGISFDGFAAAAPIEVELLTTGAVAATVTAHVAAGVPPFNDAGAPASIVTLGTAATGYTASAEGVIAATRVLDTQFVAPTNQYVKQFPLGREPEIPISTFLRIRVKAAAAVNCICYIIFE